MGLVEVVVDGVLLVAELLLQVFVDGQLHGQVLDEAGYLHVALVLPGRCVAPVVVEAGLYHPHLLDGGLLGIALHAGVEGGVDFEAFGVEGVAVIVVLLAPVLQVVGHGLAEVVGLAVVGALYAVVELDVLPFQRFALLRRQVPVVQHVVEYDVAAAQRVLGIDARVVVGGGLQQSYEHGGLVGGELGRLDAEVGLGGRFDAEGIGAEVYGVGVHGQYLFFREVPLQLVGRYPLLALHDEHLQSGDVAQEPRGVLGTDAEQVLGQLLRDGGGATGVAVHDVVLQRCAEGLVVDAVVVVEPLVLGVDEGFPEGGAHLVVGDGHAVLAEELADDLAVGAEYLRGLGRVGVLHVAHRRRLAEEPQQVDVDHQQVEHERHEERAGHGQTLDVPGASLVQSFIPSPGAAQSLADFSSVLFHSVVMLSGMLSSCGLQAAAM